MTVASSDLVESATDSRRRLWNFAIRVAGPRDFVINLLINGSIAWWIFGGRAAIPLTGAGSIFDMLLPMSFIEGTLTTFFGDLNGRNELQRIPSSIVMPSFFRWFIAAIGYSLLWGGVSYALAHLGQIGLRWQFPAMELSPPVAVAVIGFDSALLAFWLHTQAVATSHRRGRIVPPAGNSSNV